MARARVTMSPTALSRMVESFCIHARTGGEERCASPRCPRILFRRSWGNRHEHTTCSTLDRLILFNLNSKNYISISVLFVSKKGGILLANSKVPKFVCHTCLL